MAVSRGAAGGPTGIVGGIQGCGSKPAVSGLGPPAGAGGAGQGLARAGLDSGDAAELDADELLDGPGGQAGWVEFAAALAEEAGRFGRMAACLSRPCSYPRRHRCAMRLSAPKRQGNVHADSEY